MIPSLLQINSFYFPYNPRMIACCDERDESEDTYIGKGSCVFAGEIRCTRVVCKGSFYGRAALWDYMNLRQAMLDGEGVICIPGFATQYGFIKSLNAQVGETPDKIDYELELVLERPYSGYYVNGTDAVFPHDDVYSFAARHEMPLDVMAEANIGYELELPGVSRLNV